MRTHLYGSLLYYLQIAQRPDEPDTLEAGMVQLYYGKEGEKKKKKRLFNPERYSFFMLICLLETDYVDRNHLTPVASEISCLC